MNLKLEMKFKLDIGHWTVSWTWKLEVLYELRRDGSTDSSG